MTSSRTRIEELPVPFGVAVFERYFQRHLKAHLQPGLPPPTWTGTSEAWETIASEARAAGRQEIAVRFTTLLAQGWTLAEIDAGELQRGAEVANNGAVFRPAPAEPGRAALASRALAAKRQAEDGGIRVDAHLLMCVEEVIDQRPVRSVASATAIVEQLEAAAAAGGR
ncbi:MAG TPA: hypothetical protein VI789_01150 [Dehalococcoidia bacterium]|nr:hypothetical protein [Dehalococcoidia bacterium]